MILVTGGSRSGKSEYAEQLTMAMGSRYLYLATAKITDAEMARRVEKHRARRSASWTTHEGYTELEKVIADAAGKYDGMLLDSISTMVTNLLFDFIGNVDWDTFDFADVDYKAAETFITEQFEVLGRSAAKLKVPLVAVTDEIGMGVIPETVLGRAFRDILGLVNQRMASYADEVFFVVSGIPVKIK